jgi:DNA-directed RNA polymerase specialized sigma24 family protein
MSKPTPTPRMLKGDEADVYRQHHAPRLNVLRAQGNTTDPIREAWRLTTQARKNHQLLQEAPAPVDADLHLQARDDLTQIANLPDRQRRYLTLIVSGHTYADICHHTGATHTNVTKHLSRARRTLRAVQQPDD